MTAPLRYCAGCKSIEGDGRTFPYAHYATEGCGPIKDVLLVTTVQIDRRPNGAFFRLARGTHGPFRKHETRSVRDLLVSLGVPVVEEAQP